MAADQILAIDNGTQSVRALLFDLSGRLVAQSRVSIQPYFSERPGWAEQDPEYFWRSLCEACQGLWKQPGVSKDAVAGVALTTQRSTVVNLDRQGKPLRPAIVWLDQRRTAGLPPVHGYWGLMFRAGRHERNGSVPAGRGGGELGAHASSPRYGMLRQNISSSRAF